ncbi:MAG: 50S ribosomal protein L9 [Actinomycetota bacterium]|nr:50S ribosomal protein L9 [Actinomycetota bacterium]
MRVVLRADVPAVGRKGDVVDVAPGFARNHLVPKGLAIKASPGALAQAATMRRSRELKDARDRESATEIAARLNTASLRIPARAGADGRLFGSVTAADIVAAVEATSAVRLDRRRIHLEELIKTVGMHEVPLRLHADVEVKLNVEVVTEER